MSVKFKYSSKVDKLRRQCLSEKTRLNKLVEHVVSLLSDDLSKEESEFKEIELLLTADIESMTNIQDEFSLAKIDWIRNVGMTDDFVLKGDRFMLSMLKNLKSSRKKANVDNLIYEINKFISEQKEHEYIVYVPLRIWVDLSESKKVEFKQIVEDVFGFKIISELPDEVANKILKTSLLDLFNAREAILEFKGKSCDLSFFNKSVVNKNMRAFLGLMSFAGEYEDLFSRNFCELHSDSSSIRDKPEENGFFYLAFEDSELVYPESNEKGFFYRINYVSSQIRKTNAVTEEGKVIWRLHNDKTIECYSRIIKTLNALKKQDDLALECSKNYFEIYYEGITERSVEISFLKFWVLSEKIIKRTELIENNRARVPDDEIKQCLKKSAINDYRKKRIGHLCVKRNSLVHEMEHINAINKDDRNLLKVTSESFLAKFINLKDA